MRKRCFESFEVFSHLKNINLRILLNFERSISKKFGKTASSRIIDSLGGECCWIALDSEPIRLLKTPRSPSVYFLNIIIQIFNSHVKIDVYPGSQWYSTVLIFLSRRIKRVGRSKFIQTNLTKPEVDSTDTKFGSSHEKCSKNNLTFSVILFNN